MCYLLVASHVASDLIVWPIWFYGLTARLFGAGQHPCPGTPPALRLEGDLSIFGAILSHQLGMCQSPAIREKISQVGRPRCEVRRVVLLGIGQFA